MLVATDVAARGVHVDDVELVVHVDPPTEHKAYLHRSGRTARAGSEGDVVTLVLPAQEKDVAQLLRKAGIRWRTQRGPGTSDAVRHALVGDVAAYVKPAPRQRRQQQGGGGRSQGANAQRKRAVREGGQGAGAQHSRGERSRSRPFGSSRDLRREDLGLRSHRWLGLDARRIRLGLQHEHGRRCDRELVAATRRRRATPAAPTVARVVRPADPSTRRSRVSSAPGAASTARRRTSAGFETRR